MKKILLVLVLLLFSSTAFAASIKKSGFVDKKLKVNKNLEVSDPSNKIIIIHNHGSDETDRKKKGNFTHPDLYRKFRQCRAGAK